MAIFVILFTISLALYLFYKFKAFKANAPYQRAWVNSKSSIALGMAMVFFGINAILLNPKTAIIIIGVVLIIVGGYFVFQSARIYRHFKPLAAEELRQSRNQS